jgi:L-alanine-DL-glutamate epimerase-like enolase superfamily enzyme
MLGEPIVPGADGMLAVPSRPGLGVSLDEEAVAYYSLDEEVRA